jgi:hypothetical protein
VERNRLGGTGAVRIPKWNTFLFSIHLITPNSAHHGRHPELEFRLT